MTQTEILNSITGKAGIRSYLTAETYELQGCAFSLDIPGMDSAEVSFAKNTLVFNGKESVYHAVKCEDTVYLIAFDDQVLLMDSERKDAVLRNQEGLHSKSFETILTGWEEKFYFAPEINYVLAFSEDAVEFGDVPFKAEYTMYTEDLAVVSLTAETGSALIVIDMARFLFYGSADGELNIGGGIEIPE